MEEGKKYPQANYRLEKDVTDKLKAVSADVGIPQAEILTELINAFAKAADNGWEVRAFDLFLRRCADKKGLTVAAIGTDAEAGERMKRMEAELAELKVELKAERLTASRQADRFEDERNQLFAERGRLNLKIDRLQIDREKMIAVIGKGAGISRFSFNFGQFKSDCNQLCLTFSENIKQTLISEKKFEEGVDN
jgi:hypothetical protein